MYTCPSLPPHTYRGLWWVMRNGPKIANLMNMIIRGCNRAVWRVFAGAGDTGPPIRSGSLLASPIVHWKSKERNCHSYMVVDNKGWQVLRVSGNRNDQLPTSKPARHS